MPCKDILGMFDLGGEGGGGRTGQDEYEDEEEEGDKILKQVLDEIGVDLSQQVRMLTVTFLH